MTNTEIYEGSAPGCMTLNRNAQEQNLLKIYTMKADVPLAQQKQLPYSTRTRYATCVRYAIIGQKKAFYAVLNFIDYIWQALETTQA